MIPIPKLTYIQTERFWSRVDKRGPNECWNWVGPLNNRQQGRFSLQDRGYLAHRIAYFLHTEYDPVNSKIHQTCGNPVCCNPAHLTTIPTQVGTNHPKARLTESKVREIRDRYLDGNSQRALSRKFDVSQSTIRDIVNRKTWLHV